MDTGKHSERLDSLSRRSFLTGFGTLAAGGAVVGSLAHPPLQAVAAEVTSDTASAEEVKIFDSVALSMGRVVHNPDLCAGCRQCEIVCTINKLGVVDPELSLVRIRTDILGGYISEAEFCKQCPGPECVAICPNKACHIDPQTGARVIDKSLCVGCQLCLNACPLVPSRVHYNAAENICMKCDLCGGEPVCVAHCPAHALSCSWIEQEDDATIFETESGIVVELALSGAVLVVDRTAVTIENINAEIATGNTNGVFVRGDITSTYTQPFTAKIKTTYFNANGETLFVSERLELEVEVGGTTSFEDVFETSAPEQVSRVYLEIMCGKIAG